MALRSADQKEAAARLAAALRAGASADNHPAEAELAAWLDGALAGARRKTLEAHIATCEDCAEWAALAAEPLVPETRPQRSPAWRIAAGILLLLGGIAAAVTAGRTTREQIETLALDRVDGLLGGRVSAGTVALLYDEGPALAFRDLEVRVFEDTAPLLEAPQAVLRPDFQALAAGTLRGRLFLPGPSFSIFAHPNGLVSIDPLLPDPARPAAVREKAWRSSLDEVRLEDASVRYVDLGSPGRPVVRASAVNATIRGIASDAEIRFSMTAAVQDAQPNLALEGLVVAEAEGGPRWTFSRVELAGVPLAVFGNLEGHLAGRLDFEGSLLARGVGWRTLWSSLGGRGKVRIEHGVLRGLELPGMIAGLPRQPPDGLAFESAQGDLRWQDGHVALDSFALQARDWSFRGRVERDAAGTWEVEGTAVFASNLVGSDDASEGKAAPRGEVRRKVRLRGRWPDLQRIDATQGAEEVTGSAIERAATGFAPLPAPADLDPLAGALRRTDAALRRRGESVPVLARVLANLERGMGEPDLLFAGLQIARSDQVLLTGYFEPVLDARMESRAPFVHAIHSPPLDPEQRALPRIAIADGALDQADTALFFVADPVELFFLHVQGSGVVRLADGSLVRVGYAGNNGHEYHSIGTELVRRGALSLAAADAPGIRRWLRTHPDEQKAILNTNPRYIFFRARPHTPGEGPVGSLGVPLEAWHSVAADPAVTRPGTLGRLRATLPDGRALDVPVVAMDTGAAIRGPDRLDLFLGTGDAAGALAGILRAPARVDWFAPD